MRLVLVVGRRPTILYPSYATRCWSLYSLINVLSMFTVEFIVDNSLEAKYKLFIQQISTLCIGVEIDRKEYLSFICTVVIDPNHATFPDWQHVLTRFNKSIYL